MTGSYSEEVWMTLVALAYLNAALSKLQPSWILVADKAEKWIATQAELADTKEENLFFPLNAHAAAELAAKNYNSSRMKLRLKLLHKNLSKLN